MWGVGLAMCVLAIFCVATCTVWKAAYFWFAFLLVGLVTMWVGS